MELPEFLTPPIILALALVLGFCILCLIGGLKLGLRQGRKLEAAEWESGKLEGIVKARLKQSRATLGGLVTEQIAPLLAEFPFDPGDCRFIGKPVDFIVFRGMNSDGISEVVFVEVKTGKSKSLNPQERRLREVIQSGKVRWVQFDV